MSLSGIRQGLQSLFVTKPPPPPTFWERMPDGTIFYGILGLNGLVLGMWCGAHWKARHDQRAVIWMRDHFQLSWRNIASGRVWTLVTSFFSYDPEDPRDLFFCGHTFYSMARTVLNVLGNKSFLLLYIGGSVAANIVNLAWRKVVGGQNYPSFGARAATYSMVSFLACTTPSFPYNCEIISVPIWVFATGSFAYESYSAVTDRRKRANAAGHVAGFIAGAGLFLGRRYRIF